MPLAASADVSIKDATFKTYLRYTNAMIRIDKIESVRHIDGNPILGDFDPGDDTGYLIVSLSVQNPGTAEIFMPNFGTVLFLEDQSKIEGDFRGPYVGAKTVEAPGRIAPKESLRVRYVVPGWTGTPITKIVLNSNDTAPQLRFEIHPGDITPIAEVPRPSPSPVADARGQSDRWPLALSGLVC